MRNRAAVLIIESGKIAVIERIREGKCYFVFPGGGIEPHETAETAAVREAKEELGVDVQIIAKPAITKRTDGSVEFYFPAKILSGTFGTGNGVEYDVGNGRGSYRPTWVGFQQLLLLDIFPREIAQSVVYKKIADS
ncbi:MAG TPA: NUDIX domain-containing protein [Bacillales bacterium]|nr:NUDIX domain-containing protein [Bacillales bacterium]